MIILYYLILFMILSVSGKDKKKDSKVIFNLIYSLSKSDIISSQTKKIKSVFATDEVKARNNDQRVSSQPDLSYPNTNGKNPNFLNNEIAETNNVVQKEISPEKNKLQSRSFEENEEWEIEETGEKENFKNIAETIVHASNQKNFQINLDELINKPISQYQQKKNEFSEKNVDLSKKENHDSFFEYFKYEDKLRYENKNNNQLPKQVISEIHQEILDVSSAKNPFFEINNNEKLGSPPDKIPVSMKIKVSFVAEKSKTPFEQLEASKKRESKLRNLRNFSYRHLHLLLIDDKYFLDSFYPLFSICRYNSVTNPKIKRILLLALTFQIYMLFSGIFFYYSVQFIFRIYLKILS